MTSNAIVEALSEKRRSTISRRDLKGKPPKHYIVRYTTFRHRILLYRGKNQTKERA